MGRVICAGHVNWDVTLRVDRLPPTDGEARISEQRQSGGGSASNAAVVLAGLGQRPTLLGSVGTDENGWLARRELEEAGVDTALVEATGRQTSVKYLVVDDDGDVLMLGNDGANECFDAADLPSGTLDDADHLHLTGQRPETAATLARVARDAGVPVSFDPGRRIEDRDYGETLANVDLCFFNEREADIARETGAMDHVSTAIVKSGSGGARIETASGTVTHPGFAVDPIDTTGAGDAFAAGFVAGRFDGSQQYALAVGNACGALAARTTGARLHVTWRDVEALLDIGPAEEASD